jgi:hypothetical protein
MVKNFIRSADLFHVPVIHHHDLVRDLQGLILVVRDENTGHMQLVVEIAQPGPQLFPYLGVECAEWLVQQQDFGFHGQGAGEGDPLALAAGELAGIALGEPLELNKPEKLVNPVLDFLPSRPAAAFSHTESEGDVLEYVHVTEERVVLENETDPAVAYMGLADLDIMEEDGARAGSAECGAGWSSPSLKALEARPAGPWERSC